MNRKDAYEWNKNTHDTNFTKDAKEMEESIHFLLKRIFDFIENKKCGTCKYFVMDPAINKIGNCKNYFPQTPNFTVIDFDCKCWELKK